MGMNLSILRKRNIGTPNEESVEVYYARKFWELLNAPFVVEYNDSKERIDTMKKKLNSFLQSILLFFLRHERSIHI